MTGIKKNWKPSSSATLSVVVRGNTKCQGNGARYSRNVRLLILSRWLKLHYLSLTIKTTLTYVFMITHSSVFR